MKLTHNNILNFRNLCIIVCFVFWALSEAQAQTLDINKIWTTVGSTGTVDEADVSKIFFDRSIVQMGNVIANPTNTTSALIPQQTQSATIRYNITPVEGLFAVKPPCFTQTGTECPGIQLKLRYLAFGSRGRVIANLIEVDLATGAEVTRLSFDSKVFSSGSQYQVQSVAQCGPGTPRQPFDFENKAYYVEARLTTGAFTAGDAAGIQIVKVANISCIG
jgi:hypothetical protein